MSTHFVLFKPVATASASQSLYVFLLCEGGTKGCESSPTTVQDARADACAGEVLSLPDMPCRTANQPTLLMQTGPKCRSNVGIVNTISSSYTCSAFPRAEWEAQVLQSLPDCLHCVEVAI